MSAAPLIGLTAEELRDLLEQAAEMGAERALARVGKGAKKAAAMPVLAPPKPEISETDRAAARAYARQLGMVVKTKGTRR